MLRPLLLACLFSTLYLSAAQAQTPITAAQVESIMHKDKTVQLIDLRTPAEVQQTGVIPGARVINFMAPDFSTQTSRLDKQKPVIVYCAAGGRSPRAAQQMKQAGFKTIYDYTGGMNDWQSKGKKTAR